MPNFTVHYSICIVIVFFTTNDRDVDGVAIVLSLDKKMEEGG
jgi:hypothetical protein